MVASRPWFAQRGPNAKLRRRVVPQGPPAQARAATEAVVAAELEFRTIEAILERPVIEKILTHLGLDPQPPPKGRSREAGHDFAS